MPEENHILSDETSVSKEKLVKSITKIEKFLDSKIGFYWWKKYIAAAFWSNIATPINLFITLVTALTTGQAVTSILSITVLIISTLNTFFRPHTQLMENVNEMQKWGEFGREYTNIYNNIEEDLTQSEYERLKEKLKNYRMLEKKINDFMATQSNVQQNFVTDLIHIIARKTCLRRGKESWMYFLKSNEEDEGCNASCCNWLSCCKTQNKEQGQRQSNNEMQVVSVEQL
jgi:hypothetical protein